MLHVPLRKALSSTLMHELAGISEGGADRGARMRHEAADGEQVHCVACLTGVLQRVPWRVVREGMGCTRRHGLDVADVD